MSRICRNMGDSGKLRFYELAHESKMRLLKNPLPHSLPVWLWSQEHAKKSSRKKRGPYNKAIITHQKPAVCRRCGGRGRKGSRICRMPPVWRGGQERLYGKPTTEKGTMARQALVDMEGNTGANTREKSCEKPRAGHRG